MAVSTVVTDTTITAATIRVEAGGRIPAGSIPRFSVNLDVEEAMG